MTARLFLRGVWWGSVASASPYLPISFMFFLLGLTNGDHSWSSLIYGPLILFLPLLVSYPLTFCGAFFFGLPIALYLEKRGWTRLWVFVLCGSAAGALFIAIFNILSSHSDGSWLTLLGAIGGAATTASWARGLRANSLSPSIIVDKDIS